MLRTTRLCILFMSSSQESWGAANGHASSHSRAGSPTRGRLSMEAPGSRIGEAQVRERSEITIAIVGGNTVAGHALSLLLESPDTAMD
jgi:hypothetical protein